MIVDAGGNGTDFTTATAGDGLVLIDLWSPDCAPCRSLSPILDDLAEDFAADLSVRKADVMADPALGERFGARALPTLALYRDGAEIDRIVGLRTRSQLMAWIEAHL